MLLLNILGCLAVADKPTSYLRGKLAAVLLATSQFSRTRDMGVHRDMGVYLLTLRICYMRVRQPYALICATYGAGTTLAYLTRP
jgi:hypothetical protein